MLDWFIELQNTNKTDTNVSLTQNVLHLMYSILLLTWINAKIPLRCSQWKRLNLYNTLQVSGAWPSKSNGYMLRHQIYRKFMNVW